MKYLRMIVLNKSFILGVFVASITWTICLYVLTQTKLTEVAKESVLKKGVEELFSNEDSKESENVLDNNIIPEKHKGKVHNLKDYISGKAGNNKYVNSDKLIKELQPIVVKTNDNAVLDEALQELGMVRTKEDKLLREEGYKIHAYNVLVSNQLSYHRSVPDTRNQLCQSVKYPDSLPKASIIICFYNEHFQTLIRTIHSIIDRTPITLLQEIILIDDFSDLKDLHSQVEQYINKNFQQDIRLYKTERREGLIRARTFGARKAKGDVIVFLDSHVEVNEGWIQPLLNRIKENRTNVVMPIIDIINADTFDYSASPIVRGGFNWGLYFKWENVPKDTLVKDEDFIKPIKSPTMAGGLFAMNRKYFKEIGEYDEGMDIWGGENLEISFRIWMCGGQLELVPCSRVGHVFRKRRPYGDPSGKDTMLHNSLRVAHVWMDDYKEYFLNQLPRGANKENYGDLSSRLQLRKELKCHDFDWYLKNVYPELGLPTDNEERLKEKWKALEQDQFQPWHSRKRDYVGHYQLRLSNSTLCMQSQKDTKTKGSSVILRPCVRSKNQIWYETTKHELVLAQLLCLQADNGNPYLYKCHEMGGDQEWKHKGENKTPIYNMAAGTCLGVREKKVEAQVVMQICTEPILNMWDLVR